MSFGEGLPRNCSSSQEEIYFVIKRGKKVIYIYVCREI